MSIAGLNIGTRGIQANMIALEVAGQNIANVNNPEYTRQRAKMEADLTIPRPFGQFGTGVKISQLQQIKDAFIDGEIQDQLSDTGKQEALFSAYERLEAIYSEGPGFGLNEQLGSFFNSLHDLASFPEDAGLRRAVLGEAELLTNQINFLNTEIDNLRTDLNTELRSSLTEINSLLSEIASLNVDIVQIEAGNTVVAADLRDKRTGAVNELSEYIEIYTTEMDSGALNISSNGRSLVFAGEYNTLSPNLVEGDELQVHNVVVTGTSDEIDFQKGKIGGILEARDTDIVSYRDNLDTLVGELIEQFNAIHATGRGLEDYSTLTSENSVTDITDTINNVGLTTTPVDGTLSFNIIDTSDNSESQFSISIDVSTDSLEDIALAITSQSPRITATANADGTLGVSTSSGYEFAFTGDTTNLLEAMGINNFFSGSDASDISVNSALISNPSLIATARGTEPGPGDTTNILDLAQLRDTLVLTNETQTFEDFYQAEVSRLGAEHQSIEVAAEAASSFLTQLQLKREAVSGVNLDEELANMVKFQHGLQASARFVGVMNEMLNVLVNGLV